MNDTEAAIKNFNAKSKTGSPSTSPTNWKLKEKTLIYQGNVSILGVGGPCVDLLAGVSTYHPNKTSRH